MNLIRYLIFLFSIFLLLVGVALYIKFSFLPFALLSFCAIILISVTLILYYLTFVIEIHQKNLSANLNEKISGKVNPIIYIARSVFPFQLFPDIYILQEKTLSIIRKKFFFSAWTETIPIKDIASIRLYTGPLFVSLTILRKILPQTSIEMTDLWKNDGLKFKELLDALIMKENKLVRIPATMSLTTRKKFIYEIGHENEVEKEI